MNLDVRDAWPPSFNPPPVRQRVQLRPGISERISTVLAPIRRGTREAGIITIHPQSPLHLGACQMSLSALFAPSVLPEFKACILLPSRPACPHEFEGTTLTTLHGAGTEFDSLCSYVVGDDPHDIDRRASARSTELMVRQWRPERDRHVVVVVDYGRASSALPGALEYEEIDSIALGYAPRFDSSIETALPLAALADRAGNKVHLIIFDLAVRARVSGMCGAKVIETLAHTSTDISPRPDVTSWSEMIGMVEQTVHHSVFVVTATKIPPVDMKTEFTDMLARLSDHHTVLAASATDPDEIRVRAGREDVEQVFLAASVSPAEWSDEVGATDARLAGALTVRASAGLLPVRTTDRYIELKKSGRL